MGRESLVHIVMHDITRSQKRREIINELVYDQPDVSLIHTDDSKRTVRETEHGSDIILINTTGKQDLPQLLDSITSVRPEKRPPLLVIGRHKSLDEVIHDCRKDTLTDKDLHQRLSALFQVDYIPIKPGYLAVLKNQLILSINVARAIRVVEMNKNALDIEEHFTRYLSAGQLATLALSMWAQAKDIEHELQEKNVDATQRQKLTEEQERCNRYASKWLQSAYEDSPADNLAGKVTFRVQATEGGGVRFRSGSGLTFVRHRKEEGAKMLVSTYRAICKKTPYYKVPGPDPVTGEYPCIKIDDDRVLVASTHIPGPTIRDLLNERNNLDRDKLGPHLKQFAQLFSERLLQKLLQDQAVFEYIIPELSLAKPVKTIQDRQKLAGMYISHVLDAAHYIISRSRLGDSDTRRHNLLSTTRLALEAMTPFSPNIMTAYTLRIDDASVLPRRDNSMGNIVLRRPSRLKAGQYELEYLFEKIHRRATKDLHNQHEKTTTHKEQDLLTDRIDSYLKEEIHHFDFSERVTTFGEDFFQLMLEPEWQFVDKENDVRDEIFAKVIDENLLRYAVYQLMVEKHRGSPFLLPNEGEHRSKDDIIEEGFGLLHEMAHGSHPLRRQQQGWLRRKREPQECVREFINENGGRDPAEYAYHLDWMWYYRAMRGAGIATGIFTATMPPEKVDALARHYLKYSIEPLDRMRYRLYDDWRRRGKVTHYYKNGIVPSRNLDIESTLANFNDQPHDDVRVCGENARANDEEQDFPLRAELQLLRLDCLAALSRLFLSYTPEARHG